MGMTKNSLERLFWLKKSISLHKERLDTLTADGSVLGLPPVDSLIHGAAIANAVAEQKLLLETRINEAISEYSELNRIIDSIDDPYMKQLFTMRFVENLSYAEITMRFGGGLTPGTLCKDVHRYRKKIENQKARKQASAAEYSQLVSFINNISNPYMKHLFTLCFIERKSWDEVAKLGGNGLSGDTIRHKIYDYKKECGFVKEVTQDDATNG